jgi:hypothetical protein
VRGFVPVDKMMEDPMRCVMTAALAVVGLVATAEAQQWRTEPLGGPAGWAMLSLGDIFAEPETAAVRIRYEKIPLGFMYGCDRGQSLSVWWRPSRPLQAAAGSNVPVALSINGTRVDRSVMQLNSEGVLVLVEATGAAGRIVKGVDAARKGVLVISGGGVSDSVPFDETLNGGAAEYALAACEN